MLKSIRVVAVLFILAALLLATGSPVFEVSAAPPAVGVSPTLVAAASYSVLAYSTVTNTGPTTVSGDLGVSPGTAVTGFFPSGPGTVGPPGTIHAGDGHAAAAQADNTVAFGFLAQPCDVTYTGVQDLAGVSPLAPGVYCADAFTLSTNLILTGSGVWIFKSTSTLITSPGSSVTGGDPCNVWWRVGSSATLDTNTAFVGNILALASIGLNTGASLNGRAMAQTAAVTLNDNAISLSCSPPLGVFLLSFTAEPDDNAIRLDWETASELNNVGFNVYRGASADGTDRTLLDFVPSQGPGSNQGFSYRYDDTDVEIGQTYWYWLEDIDLNGATTLHGPVSATINAPTAVGLTSLDASTAAAPAFSLGLIGLVGLTILAVWWRKRDGTVGLGNPPVI